MKEKMATLEEAQAARAAARTASDAAWTAITNFVTRRTGLQLIYQRCRWIIAQLDPMTYGATIVTQSRNLDEAFIMLRDAGNKLEEAENEIEAGTSQETQGGVKLANADYPGAITCYNAATSYYEEAVADLETGSESLDSAEGILNGSFALLDALAPPGGWQYPPNIGTWVAGGPSNPPSGPPGPGGP